jgi:hypothetical protein
MGPFGAYLTDDLEDTPLGSAPVHWAAPGLRAVCVANRGSRWAELTAPADALVDSSSRNPGRVELDIEVAGLGAATGSGLGFSLEPRVAIAITRQSQQPSVLVLLGGTQVDVGDPVGAPHHLEIVCDGTEWLYLWDGAEVTRVSALPRLSTSNTRAWALGVGTRLLLDNIRLSQDETGGVCLASDGLAVCRATGGPTATSQPHPRLAMALAPPGFAPDVAMAGRQSPSVALLADGTRVAASEDSVGVRAWRLRTLHGDPRSEGDIMVLHGHGRPALCALPERGEVLLLTHLGGALVLTRGRVGGAALDWLVSDQQTVVESGVAEATPAICALPDGRLLACYQDLECSVHDLVSADGGRTWT